MCTEKYCSPTYCLTQPHSPPPTSPPPFLLFVFVFLCLPVAIACCKRFQLPDSPRLLRVSVRMIRSIRYPLLILRPISRPKVPPFYTSRRTQEEQLARSSVCSRFHGSQIAPPREAALVYQTHGAAGGGQWREDLTTLNIA